MKVETIIRAGRKGRMSGVDALVVSLLPSADALPPELTFEELRQKASLVIGYELAAATVRSHVYRNGDLFERASSDSRSPKWRLTRAAIAARVGAKL